MQKYFSQLIKVAFLALLFGAIAVSAQLVGPPGPPTTSNAPLPLNVSSTNQTKSGGLTIGGLWVGGGGSAIANGNTTINGHVSVRGGLGVDPAGGVPATGTIAASNMLRANGSILTGSNVFASLNGFLTPPAGALSTGSVIADQFCLSGAQGSTAGCINLWPSGGGGTTLTGTNNQTVRFNGTIPIGTSNLTNDGTNLRQTNGTFTIDNSAMSASSGGHLLFGLLSPAGWNGPTVIKGNKPTLTYHNGNVQGDIAARSFITQTITNSGVCADATGKLVACSSGLPNGTNTQTIRHNGTGWVNNSVLTNNGTIVGINTSAPDALMLTNTGSGNNAILGNKDTLQFWSTASGGHNADVVVRDLKADRDVYVNGITNWATTQDVCINSTGKLVACPNNSFVKLTLVDKGAVMLRENATSIPAGGIITRLSYQLGGTIQASECTASTDVNGTGPQAPVPGFSWDGPLTSIAGPAISGTRFVPINSYGKITYSLTCNSSGSVYYASQTMTIKGNITYRTASTTNFVIPTGANVLTIKAWGGGGGGGGAGANVGAGGGGGGAYVERQVSLDSYAPGTNVQVIVGDGGNGGPASTGSQVSAGSNGGDSQVRIGSTNVATAGGGKGPAAGSGSNGPGGAIGGAGGTPGTATLIGSGLYTLINGYFGQTGVNQATRAGGKGGNSGGGGGEGGYGGGGGGSNVPASGNAFTGNSGGWPGGGGGGGASGGPGGHGGVGMVVLEWE